jgi:hypothetical protein
MKATELRIGNIVDLGNRIAKVIEIGHSSCVVVDLDETQDTIEDYERVQGLILTDEWLLKFGFLKITEQNPPKYGVEYIFRIQIEDRTYLIKPYNSKFFNCNTATDIEYIHQLQNLYFALTNKELTAKED